MSGTGPVVGQRLTLQQIMGACIRHAISHGHVAQDCRYSWTPNASIRGFRLTPTKHVITQDESLGYIASTYLQTASAPRMQPREAVERQSHNAVLTSCLSHTPKVISVCGRAASSKLSVYTRG